ncbi:MAG: hypothetical protein COB15_15945 [Flavobacteriales bacterium]|nr:MAG: hypothetical protein COB15_15945 [Flavobacteriales bacterium]
MLRYKKIVALCLIVFTFFSCRKDFERANWDVDVLAPLIKTTLTLEDLFPDSIIQTNPDTSIKLVYQTNIFDIDMDSLFQIPDTTIAEVYIFPLSSLANPGASFYSNSEENELNISNGVELNYVQIESGFIEIEIYSEIQEKIIVTYTIPSATKNGDTLVLNDIIPAGTLLQDGYYKKLIDISGYELDLTGISKSEVNTLVTRAIGVVDTNATGPVTIFSGSKITYNNKLMDIIPSFVRGYFGAQQLHFGPEITNTTAFNMITSGTLDLEAVDVNIEFKNGIGVDAQLILNQFSTSNINTGASNVLSHSSIGTPLNLNRAQLTNSIPEVTYSSYNITMNPTNSNIDQLIEIFPNQILYDINLNINPIGNISGGNDFVYKKHSLETNLNVEFPLSLIANNLTLQDTVDFSLSQEGAAGDIIDGVLFLYASNGYPFDATIKMGLYDENMNFIQNLTIENQIKSAPVNAALRVTSKKESVLSIPLTSSDITSLYAAKHILLNIAFTTTAQPQFIKIYEGYAIDIKVVGDFSYNVNSN